MKHDCDHPASTQSDEQPPKVPDSTDVVSRARQALAEVLPTHWVIAGNFMGVARAYELLAELADEVERLRAEYDQAVADWGANDEMMLADNARLAAEVERLRGCPHDSWSGDGKGRWRCDECGADQGSQAVADVVHQLDKARAEVERLSAPQQRETSMPDRPPLPPRGYELVQLPDPEPREDGEDEVGSQWERVGEFRVTVWDEYPDEVALSYDFEPYEPFTPAEARSLAAALLAAANRVEGESK